MKSIIILFSFILLSITTYSQQNNPSIGIGTNLNGNFSSGDVLAIGDSDTGFKQQGDGELGIFTNNVERLRVDKSGNLGIGGITNPIATLENGGLTYLRSAPTRDLPYEQLRIGRKDKNIRYHSIYSNHTPTPSTNFLQFKLHNGTGLDNRGQTTVMTLKGSGNVGIGGILDPIATLENGGLTYLRRAPSHSTPSEQLRIGRKDSNIRYHSIYSNHTANPSTNFLQFKLHNGTGSDNKGQATVMTLKGSGNVGIGGILDPIATLENGGLTYLRRAPSHSIPSEQLRIGRKDSNIRYHSIYSNHTSNPSANFLQFRLHNGTGSDSKGQSTIMTLQGNGKVGIGTLNPQNKLSVQGTIWAREVKVSLSDAADWVFDDDYKLRPLAEVASYIEENKHLPEIPSAEEFRKNDLKVSEMTNKLLQKIEELTLYTIEQEKKLKDVTILKQNNSFLTKKNKELERRIKKIESLILK